MSDRNGSGEQRIFAVWWKSFASILLSLAAVGAVFWALGSKFFVTREEFIDVRYNSLPSIETKVNGVQRDVKKIGDDIESIRVKISEFANRKR